MHRAEAPMTRRDLMRVAGQAALATSVAPGMVSGMQPAGNGSPGAGRSFLLFSKHLPDLKWDELGRAVKNAGFDGVDLTTRTAGHVLPQRAAEDLPRAIDAIKAQGVSVPMITTELTSPSDPTARPLLKTAAANGVRYFKTGYWRYNPSSPDVRGQVATVGEALSGLAALAREYGIELGFHNHAAYIGAALWEIAPAMEKLDPKWAGYYFDPRHAVAEGGGGSWKAATYLVAPRMKMMAIKDFFWEKTDKGWRIHDCPMGEGMVDWTWLASTLKGKFAGPISLHIEYEIPGTTPQERTKRTIEFAVKDLAFARRVLA
jgi:L-ribulose-5-phosphate 3-epimerase